MSIKLTQYPHCLVASLIGFYLMGIAQPASATFAQSLEGSCHVASNGQCYIDVDKFTVQVNEPSGERAAQFILSARETDTGQTTVLWSFHTSNTYSYKPVGDYTPPMPPNDFAAKCDTTYSLSIITRGDTASTVGNFGVAGRTGDFYCPAPFIDSTDIIFQDSFE